MKRTVLFMSLLATPVVARAQAAKADTVKLGTYQLEVTMESGTLTGELTVKREKGDYVAFIRAGGMTPEVQSFKREGSAYVLRAGNTEHSVVYQFRFAKDSVKGTFTLGGGMSGTVAGLFKP
jgi:hypothetical protein